MPKPTRKQAQTVARHGGIRKEITLGTEELRYEKQLVVEVKVSQASLPEFCILLYQLDYNLIERVCVIGANGIFSLEILKDATHTPSDHIILQIVEETPHLIIAEAELQKLIRFLLVNLRDGMAAVDHFEIKAVCNHSEVLTSFEITFRAAGPEWTL